jgi:regulator-associated protein of mTOR
MVCYRILLIDRVFNKNYTQYIPVSIFDVQTWLGSPSIFVYDCSNAGNILIAFNRFASQRDKRPPSSPSEV